MPRPAPIRPGLPGLPGLFGLLGLLGLLALLGLVLVVLLALLWTRSRPGGPELAPTARTGVAEQPEPEPRDLLAAAPAPATQERNPVATNAAGEERPSARLRIRASDARTGEPLQGVAVSAGGRIGIVRFGAAQDLAEILSQAADSMASKEESLLGRTRHTDADGNATLQVPAGIALAVHAQGAHWLDGFASVDVDALAEGEERELAIAVPVGGDATLHGLVLDRAGRLPLPDVEVVLVEGGTILHATSTDAAGRFRMRVRYDDDLELALRRGGYGDVRGKLERGHESETEAVVFVLGGTATLAGVVRTVAAPLAHADVVVAAFREDLLQPRGFWDFPAAPRPALDAPQWWTSTDADGRFSLGDLPSGIALYVTAGEEEEGLVTGWHAAGCLAPGETRRLDLLAAAPVTLRGSVVDQEGEPVRALPVWLVPVDSSVERYLDASFHDPEKSTLTGEDGRYEIAGVPPGAWLLGPAPEPDRGGFARLFARPAPRAGHNVAPWGTYVETRAGDPAREVDLAVARGLYLRGLVRDGEGRPVENAWVHASVDGRGPVRGASSGADGSFQLGPVAARLHDVFASHSGYGDSAQVSALPETAVEFELGPPGGEIHGTVRLHGAPVAGAFVVAGHADDDITRTSVVTSRDDGTFVLSRLPPGTYGVAANLEGSRMGLVLDVRVDAAGAPQVEIELAATSQVRVHYVGDERGVLLTARVAGVYVTATVIALGCVGTLRLPPGPATLEVQRFNDFVDRPALRSTREIVVPSGATLEVEVR